MYYATTQGPNELAASWAPATADTALVSAETKPLTEKLLPSAKQGRRGHLQEARPQLRAGVPHMPILIFDQAALSCTPMVVW